jgi:pentatricopeptide repeat protein
LILNYYYNYLEVQILFKNHFCLMKKYFALFLLLLIVGCSSEKQTLNNENNNPKEVKILEKGNKNVALDHFITGATYEAKEDYANAILEFQDALRYDTAAGIYYALAKNYYYLNKVSLAMENAEKAVKLDSSKSDYYYLLSELFTNAGQFDSAAVVLENLIRNDSSQVSAYYKLAEIYENSKPLKAAKIYNKLTNLVGDDWDVLIHVASLEEKLGNTKKASEAYQELLKMDPSNKDLQNTVLDFYFRNKMYDKAMKMVDDVLLLTPDDLDAREMKAKIYLTQGKWEPASKQFSYILNEKDISLAAKLQIGEAYFQQSLKDSTLLPVAKQFFQTIDKDTSDWQVKMYLGAIAIEEHRDSAAIEYFRKVTELAKWNNQAWIRLGGLYYDNRKYDESIKVLSEAVNTFPEDFTINFILGLSYSQKNENDKAKQYLGKAAELNPDNPDALSAYGFVLNQLKQEDEALRYLNKALTLEPKDVNILGTVGLIYDNEKKYSLCDSVYETALKIDSLNPVVNNNYAYSLSERGIQLDRALKMVQIAVKADSNNSSYLDTIGWIYFKMGKYELAKENEEKASKLSSDNAVIIEHLGDILFKIGQKDYARELWEKAFKLDTTNTGLKQKIDKGTI